MGNSKELTVGCISKEELRRFVDERYETSYEYLNVFILRDNQYSRGRFWPAAGEV